MPVSGEDYVRYGGDTTCLEIRTKNDEIIIIDAGSGIRRLGNKLLREKRYEYTMLFTHSHWDHIVGFPSFRPVFYDRTRIALIGCPAAQGNIRLLLSKAMSPPLFPVSFEKIKARIDYRGDCPLSFKVDSVEVFSINLNHPNMGTGYKFVEDGKAFVFLTDNEVHAQNGQTSYAAFVEFIKNTDLLVHDAQYTDDIYKERIGWGHSTYHQVAKLAEDTGVKELMVTHHDHFSSDKFIEKNLKDIKKKYRRFKIEGAADGKTRRF